MDEVSPTEIIPVDIPRNVQANFSSFRKTSFTGSNLQTNMCKQDSVPSYVSQIVSYDFIASYCGI